MTINFLFWPWFWLIPNRIALGFATCQLKTSQNTFTFLFLIHLYTFLCNSVYVQVFAEFHRINNVNLRNQFYKELDRHTPKLITLFRDKATKTGKIAEELAKLMRIYDLQVNFNFAWFRNRLLIDCLQITVRSHSVNCLDCAPRWSVYGMNTTLSISSEINVLTRCILSERGTLKRYFISFNLKKSK